MGTSNFGSVELIAMIMISVFVAVYVIYQIVIWRALKSGRWIGLSRRRYMRPSLTIYIIAAAGYVAMGIVSFIAGYAVFGGCWIVLGCMIFWDNEVKARYHSRIIFTKHHVFFPDAMTFWRYDRIKSVRYSKSKTRIYFCAKNDKRTDYFLNDSDYIATASWLKDKHLTIQEF